MKKLRRDIISILAVLLSILLCFYVGNHVSYSVRLSGDFYEMMKAFNKVWPIVISRERTDFIAGLVCSFIALLICYFRYKKGNYRDGEEHGSAQWGRKKDIRPYAHAEKRQNIILTKTERVRLTGFAKDKTKNINANVLCVGGSGSGKTRFFVKPNILQAHSSYVITDPKGSLIKECGSFLVRQGYKIKVLNLKDTYSMEHESMRYNPFDYIRSEADILTLVETFMANTNGQSKVNTADPFWTNAEKLLYLAYIGYIWYEGVPGEKNFSTLIYMIRESEIREDDEDYCNVIDELFSELRESGSTVIYREDGKIKERTVPGYDHFAVKQYDGFRNLATGKTAKSVLISCMARLAPFDIPQIKEITSEDDMKLARIGEEKTALFVILSDTNKAFNFLAAIFFKQLFQELANTADRKYGGSLPVPVRCLLDEFPNIGKIPDFEILISTIRSRGVSANIIVQTMAQLKELYRDNAETISGNCDSFLFLGGKEKSSLEDVSKLLGKQTIDTRNSGESSGQGNFKNHSLNYQRTGRDLMTPDEIARMKGGKCILQIRGCKPFYSDKYDLLKHANYKYLSDADINNRFNVSEYIQATTPGVQPLDMEQKFKEILIYE